jgi:outer membrane protein TolC
MDNMKKNFVFVFLLLVNLMPAGELRSTIDLALDNNEQIKIYNSQLLRSREELNAINRKQLPSLNLDSSYKYISEINKMELTLPGQGTKEIELGVHDTYDGGLTLSWLAFNGFGKESLVNIGENKLAVAELQLAKMKKDIAYRTAACYINTKLQKIQREVILTGRNRMQLQYNKVKSWVDNGTALPLDLMTISLSLAQYDQQLIASEAAIESAEDQLAILTGQKIEVPTDNLPERLEQVAPLFVSANEDVQILEVQRAVVENNRTLTAAANYPTLSLQASARSGKPGVNPVDNKWMNYTTAGAVLQWNVWDWGGRAADQAAQRQDLLTWAAQQQQLSDQIKLNYNNALRDHKAMQKQLAVLKTSVKVAQDKMQIIQDQAKNGLATATDFRDADADLTQYQLKLTQQQLNLYLKLIELDQLSGKQIKDWRI